LMEWSCPQDETQQAVEGLLGLRSVRHSSNDTTGGTTDEATSVDSTSDDVDDAPPDFDFLAVLVYDLCVLLDGSASCETQLTVSSQFVEGMIQSLRRGRDPSPAHLTGSDPFSRLVPLVEELVYLVDITNDEDVKVVRACEMVLAHTIWKMEDADGTDSEDDGEEGR
jgi:hypothetical protein